MENNRWIVLWVFFYTKGSEQHMQVMPAIEGDHLLRVLYIATMTFMHCIQFPNKKIINSKGLKRFETTPRPDLNEIGLYIKLFVSLLLYTLVKVISRVVMVIESMRWAYSHPHFRLLPKQGFYYFPLYIEIVWVVLAFTIYGYLPLLRIPSGTLGWILYLWSNTLTITSPDSSPPPARKLYKKI